MHKLLKQQIQRHLGDLKNFPPEWKPFLEAVDAAYKEAEEDYEMLERAMDLASDELIEKNADLKLEISERKKFQEDIQALTQRNQLILDSAGEGIYGLDREGKTTFVNPAAELMLGYTEEELVGKPQHSLIHHSYPDGTHYPREQCNIYAAFKDGKIHRESEEVFWRKDGSCFPVEYFSTPILENGEVIGAVVIFQDITQRIQAEARLKSYNVELEKRVEERTADLMLAIKRQEQEIQVRLKTEQALIQAKNEAENANRAKSQFLSRMSHELRTPMNAILGFGQLLEIDTTDPLSPGQKDKTDEILNAGRHLLDLINEVLDLASIESGRQKLKIEKVRIRKIAEDVVSLILPLAQEMNIQLENRIQIDKEVFVLADPTRLKQVLINLLSNAVKYNQANGSVYLSIDNDSQEVLKINVQDTGKGIPLEKQKDLFEPFNRLDAEKSNISGTGIGLTITKQIVELMNGSVSFKSVLGEGSCFTVEIPRFREKKSCVDASNFPDCLAIDGGEGRKKTVLYVEDNPVNVAVVREMFSKFKKIEFLSAKNAELGMELVEKHRPDLILMDIDLPGMDGITATEKLKKKEHTKNVPVIAVSANAFEADIKNALSKGFHSYFTKPIDMPSFIHTLNEVLELDTSSHIL